MRAGRGSPALLFAGAVLSGTWIAETMAGQLVPSLVQQFRAASAAAGGPRVDR
jgi:hypothetical protein